MAATLHHTLRNCIRGWSSLKLTVVDVRKVMKISYHERLFCLFDRDYPYSLTIKYYNPHSSLSIAPVFGGRGGFAVTSEFEESSLVTNRYMHLEDVEADIREIKKLQDIIAQYDLEQNEKMKLFAESEIKRLEAGALHYRKMANPREIKQLK